MADVSLLLPNVPVCPISPSPHIEGVETCIADVPPGGKQDVLASLLGSCHVDRLYA